MSRSPKESSSFGQEEGRFYGGRVYFYSFLIEGYSWGEILKKYFLLGHFLERAILPSFLSSGEIGPRGK